LVRTYKAGLSFALLLFRVIAQNIALLSNFTMHSAALPGSRACSLARQPCPAALPESFAPAALLGSLARQPCSAALPGSTLPGSTLPGSLTPAVLLVSLVRQPFLAVRPISTGFDALGPQSPHCTTGHQTACVGCCPDRFKLVFSPISPCFHYVSPNACARCCTDRFKPDVGKIILKVISDQSKIIFSKNDFKSDQDHIFLKNDLDLKSRSKIIFCCQSPLFEGKNFK
jgi:hypothetical protein